MVNVADADCRQAAIVSIDVVGYSTMIATDATGTVEILRDYNGRVIEPAIASYRGHLVGRAGDSWLAEFADAEAAMRCALRVQHSIGCGTKLPLRIGVNFGEVMDEGTTLHGNAVNVAVRLQGIGRPGGITLSSAVHARLRADIGCEFREIGPRVVKNIPEPIWVYRVVMKGEEDEPSTEPGPLIDLSRQVPGLPNRPALAVLPFENARHGEEHEYFSDGLAEDIINGLSRVRWFPVISRNSSFRFKNTLMDVGEIAHQLGARYVVGGSVDLSEHRLRVKAWLTQAEDRHIIWSNRYDREPHDLFAVQDEIAQGVVGSIEPEFARAEEFRSLARSLESLDHWERVRRGVWHMNRLTREDAVLARQHLDRVLVANPASVEALVQFAWWHFWDVWARRGPTEGWIEMARYARRAMALDAQDARPVLLAGIAEFMQGETVHGRNMLKRAVQMNPSLACAHSSIGSTYILDGEPELAIAPLATALRLSPNDFFVFHAFGEIAVARYMMGDYNLAVRAAEESLQLRPGYFYAHIIRVGCLARLNRMNEARAALRDFLNRRPDFSLRDIEWLPFRDRNWIGYLAEGLRLAGFATSADIANNTVGQAAAQAVAQAAEVWHGRIDMTQH